MSFPVSQTDVRPPALCTIYMFKHADCEICRASEPILDAWHLKIDADLRTQGISARQNLWVVKLDTTYGRNESYLGFKPKGTPAYLITVNGQVAHKSIGGLNEVHLDKIWKQIVKATG